MRQTELTEILNDMSGNCAVVRIRVLDRAISAIYNKAFSPHGLRATQIHVIVAAAVFGPLEVKPLCNILNMDSSTMSRALSRIEKKGYLKSEPSGKGKNLLISITDEGLDLVRRVYPDWQKAQEQVRELFGSDALKAILNEGNKMLRAGLAKLPK